MKVTIRPSRSGFHWTVEADKYPFSVASGIAITETGARRQAERAVRKQLASDAREAKRYTYDYPAEDTPEA